MSDDNEGSRLWDVVSLCDSNAMVFACAMDPIHVELSSASKHVGESFSTIHGFSDRGHIAVPITFFDDMGKNLVPTARAEPNAISQEMMDRSTVIVFWSF